MKSKNNFRVIFYIAAAVLFLTVIWIKKEAIIRSDKAEIVSTMLEWQKHGKPVNVKKIKKEDFAVYVKISAEQIDDIILGSYVTANIKRVIKEGAPFYLRVDNKKINGKVINVQQNINLNSGLYPILLKMEKAQKFPKDSIIQIYLKTQMLKDSLVIPTDSLIEENGEYFVYKVVENKVEKFSVEMGKANGEDLVIKKGIAIGDMVVTHGLSKISNGDKVRIYKCQMCD